MPSGQILSHGSQNDYQSSEDPHPTSLEIPEEKAVFSGISGR